MTSILEEIDLHSNLLKINRGDIKKFLSSPWVITLIVIFSILYLPHAFVVIEDISFVEAYEVDPGSIIDSIISMYEDFYNMNAGYHSKYYGWTYYWISFIVLAPIYYIENVVSPGDFTAFLLGVRLLFFLIGLFSVLAFYQVVYRLFKSKWLALAGGLIYISSAITARYFYFLHPESTGLLFLFLGILCLLNFRDSKAQEPRWYLIGLVCLVLSTLSKHPFLLPAVAVLFLFLITEIHNKQIPFLKFTFSWRFIKILLFTLGISLLIFFIINPHAFLEAKLFLSYQLRLSSNQINETSLIFIDGLGEWIKIIQSFPVLVISIILAPITIVINLIFVKDKLGKIYYIVNVLTGILFIGMFSLLSRFIINGMYFAPIYPILVLNLLAFPAFLAKKITDQKISFILNLFFSILVGLLIFTSFQESLPPAYTRLNYKEKTIYKIYHYIEQNIPDGSRIAHDHFVAIPDKKDVESCHYWRGCGTDYIEEFNPDYVIFNMEWTFGGEINASTQRLLDYIEDHDMVLVEVIEDQTSTQVWVWKKPELPNNPEQHSSCYNLWSRDRKLLFTPQSML